MEAETVDLSGAYPRLDDGQLEMLRRVGDERATDRGDVLYREGDSSCDFYVVLDGLVALVQQDVDGERVLGVHGRGRFLGELNLLTGQAVFETAVVREPGTVLVVEVEALRQLLAQEPELGDVILRADLLRRSTLIDLGAGLRIIGSRYSADTRRLREFAARNRVPHRWLDLEEESTAELLLRRVGVAPNETPIVLWGGKVLRNPSDAELARALGMRAAVSPDMHDVVVVGAGPSGLAVAVYGASEGLDTIVLDANATGGQAATSSRIENYLGFPTGIPGSDLADRAVAQAQRFGARVSVPARARALTQVDGHLVVQLDDGSEVPARTVVIATGARYRKPDVPRLEQYEGVGVYYAATPLEAWTCRHAPVVVVGGGNSAGQAAVFLSRSASVVHLVVRGPRLDAAMSRYLADRIERSPSITVHLCTVVTGVGGDRVLECVELEDRRTGMRQKLDARALFVFIGADPNVDWLEHSVELDDRGFVVTGPDLETSASGVFATGDVRSGSVKRVAAAVGEGSTAVRFIHDYLERTYGRAAYS